jgi:hypothetical protein
LVVVVTRPVDPVRVERRDLEPVKPWRVAYSFAVDARLDRASFEQVLHLELMQARWRMLRAYDEGKSA